MESFDRRLVIAVAIFNIELGVLNQSAAQPHKKYCTISYIKMELVVTAAQRVKKGFLRRHRKALLLGTFAGIFIAGGVKLNRLYQSTLYQLNQADEKALYLKKKKEHIIRISKESSQALICFISSLNDAIEKKHFISMRLILIEIKKLRIKSKNMNKPTVVEDKDVSSSEVELKEESESIDEIKRKLQEQWDELKVLSFAKVIIKIYICINFMSFYYI